MTPRNPHRGAASLPRWIDPDELARSGRWVRGTLQWAELGRLAGAGASGRSPAVEVGVRAFREPGGAVVIEGRVTAVVTVVCQRCLGDMDLDVQAEFLVAAARSGPEAARLRDDFDTIELGCDQRLSLVRLVEDEVLLAVPMVPRHPRRGDCDAEAMHRLDALAGGAPPRDNPFEALAALRRRKG